MKDAESKKELCLENLIYFVWDLTAGEPIPRVVEDRPPKLGLDLAKGTWWYEAADSSDPATGVIFEIGSSKHRDVAGFAFIYGPIAVFDRTNIDHLDNLVTISLKTGFKVASELVLSQIAQKVADQERALNPE